MLTDEDIVKLKSVLVTKEDLTLLKGEVAEFKKETTKSFLELRTDLTREISDSQDRILSIVATKQELQEVKSDMADLKELVQGLIVSTDSIAKAIGNLSVEYAAISTQLSRHELWIKQIAEKVGLTLAME